jgi:hypothetical protein
VDAAIGLPATGSAGSSGRECAQVDVKKVATLVVAAIVLFYVITQPTQAGQAVQDILGWLRDGAEAIITFMKSIFN